MAITTTTTAGSWSFGTVDSGFYGKIIIDAELNISVQMLEGSMELNALYLTNNDDVSVLEKNSVTGDKVKGLREDKEYKFVEDLDGNTRIEPLYEVADQKKLEIDRASSSSNLNGLRDDEGSMIKWDSMVSINSTGLAGDTTYLLDASSENSTYTLTTDQRDTLLKSSGFTSLEEIYDANFGVRGTSVGLDREDSMKLYSSDFVKDEVFFGGDEFDTDRIDDIRQVEGLFEYRFGGSKQMYSNAQLTTAAALIGDSAPDFITNVAKLSSGPEDFFMLAKPGQVETLSSLDETRDAMSGYSSIEFALSAGQILIVRDADGEAFYEAQENGFYSLTRKGIVYNGELVFASDFELGDDSRLSWRVDGVNNLYGFDMTLASQPSLLDKEQLVAA